MLIPNPLNTRSFAAPRLRLQSLALSQLRSASTRSQKLRMFPVVGMGATFLNTTTKSITILEWIGQLWADDTLETLAEITQPFSLPLPRFLREVFHDH